MDEENVDLDNENPEMDELIDFLIDWAARNNFKFVLPTDSEKDVDFININLKTNTIYVDEMNITEPLTEVG